MGLVFVHFLLIAWKDRLQNNLRVEWDVKCYSVSQFVYINYIIFCVKATANVK